MQLADRFRLDLENAHFNQIGKRDVLDTARADRLQKRRPDLEHPGLNMLAQSERRETGFANQLRIRRIWSKAKFAAGPPRFGHPATFERTGIASISEVDRMRLAGERLRRQAEARECSRRGAIARRRRIAQPKTNRFVRSRGLDMPPAGIGNLLGVVSRRCFGHERILRAAAIRCNGRL
jgi:hypothetical protein